MPSLACNTSRKTFCATQELESKPGQVEGWELEQAKFALMRRRDATQRSPVSTPWRVAVRRLHPAKIWGS